MLHLDKWYFDAQTTEELLYGWLAEMILFGKRFGLVQVNLAGGDSGRRSVLRRYRGRDVSIEGDEFRIGPNSIRSDGAGGRRLVLGLEDVSFSGTLAYRPTEAEWRPRTPLWEERSFLGRRRRMEWWVPVPRGGVEGRIGSFRAQGGDVFGYLDRVRLGAPPWALPFRRLWWGRVYAGKETLVFLRAEPRDGREAIEIGRDGERPVSRVAVEEGEPAWRLRLDDRLVELPCPEPVKDEPVVDGIGVTGRLSRAIQNRLSGSPVQRRFLFRGPGLAAVAERVDWNFEGVRP